MDRLPIIEQPFITPKGEELDGVEKVVHCPMWLSKVNVKKNCGKCLMREKRTKDYIYCKYRERMGKE